MRWILTLPVVACLTLAAPAAIDYDVETRGDWELVVAGDPGPICAKSAAACVDALAAIRAGRWTIEPPASLPTATCRPHPHCFSARSLCIEGYNCHD